MTTKNFEFDLQLFEDWTLVSSDTASTVSTDYSATDVTIGATSSGITIGAGWAGTDTVTNESYTVTDTDSTLFGSTLRARYDDVYSYAGFSGTDTSVILTIADKTTDVVENITTIGTDTTAIVSASIGAPADSLLAGRSFTGTTTAPATITVQGGGANKLINIANVGAVSSLGNNQYLIFQSGNANNPLVSLYGSALELSVAAAAFTHTINGAAIDFTPALAGVVTINGGESSSAMDNPTLNAAGNVTVRSLADQTWQVDQGENLTYGSAIVITADSDLTVTSDTNIHIAGTNAQVSASGGALKFNDTLLAATSAVDMTIAKESDSVTTVDFNAASTGTVSAGASAAGGALFNSGISSDTAVTLQAIDATDAAIVAVTGLAQGGRWAVSNKVTTASLGSDTVTFGTAGSNTLVAGSTGNVRNINTTGNVTLSGTGDHTVSLISAQTDWFLDTNYNSTSTPDTLNAVFDSSANLTLNGVDIRASVSAAKTFAAGSNDTLSLAANGEVYVSTDSVVASASGLATGSQWLVRGGNAPRYVSANGIGFNFESATDSVFGAISASTVNGQSTLSGVDSLSGNVTISGMDSNAGLKISGNAWTVNSSYNGAAVFGSTGTDVTVASATNSDVTIAAATDVALANVTFTDTDTVMSGRFNNVNVTFDGDVDKNVGVVLNGVTSDVSVVGVAALNSVDAGASVQVVGDGAFYVNDAFSIVNGKNSGTVTTNFVVGDSSALTIQGVANNESYSASAISDGTVYFDLNTGTSIAASLNGAAVSIKAADSAKTDAVVTSKTTSGSVDGIVTISGVNLKDTINTADDTAFTVMYDTDTYTGTDTYTMNVNNVYISIDSDVLTSSTPVTLSVANSTGTRPNVTLNGVGNNSTITVHAGIYNVGSSAAVTINDSIGYLYRDSNGNTTGEDASVAKINQDRNAAAESLAASVDSLASIGAFEAFKNLYSNSGNAFNGNANNISLVAGFSDTAVSALNASANAVTAGVNIYGDTALTGTPEQVTLQSFVANPITIKKIEGVSNTNTIRTAVIDVSNSNNTLVALGMDTTESTFATNHTIYGSSRASTLMVGPQATGSNVVRAGNGGNYIYHNAGDNNPATHSLYGGSGNDTIVAAKGDFVQGGAGADVFYDSKSYQISDYNFSENDVILATKLSANAAITPANVTVSGNTIAIAGGEVITVGSSTEDSATRAILLNAAGSNRTNLVWAGNYDSFLDASDLTRGAIMMATQNGGAANTVLGSSYIDTIYAGGNDSINAGAGNDIIYLASASTETGQRGATVALSEGYNSVSGWQTGFSADNGANVLQADVTTLNFRMRGEVIAYTSGSSIGFAGLDSSSGAYNFLVGDNKVTFIASEKVASVTSNDALAGYYKAEKAGEIYVSSDVTEAFSVTLSSDYFTNVTKLDLHNDSRATVWGSSASEQVTLSGNRDNGSRKYYAGGGGADTITSGGTSSLTAGNYLYFGNYAGTTFSTGRHVVNNFGFYMGSAQDADMGASDMLYLGDFQNYTGVSLTNNRLEISLGDTDKVVINESSGFSDKMVRAQFMGDATVYNMKFGASNSNTSFTYDGEANIYYGNVSRGRDTLNVASDISNVNIWLNDRRLDNNIYGGIGVINASLVADTKTTLAGNSSNNTIIAAASGTQNSLWGGGGEANSLVGGDGEDTFFYFKSYGYTSEGVARGSNDNINNVGTNDLIWLYDVTINDIDADKTAINSGSITVALTDGSAINVTNVSTETNFRLSDGQGGWQDVKAINSGNNRHWE